LKGIVVTAVTFLGLASAQDNGAVVNKPEENIKWSDYVCNLREFNNECVRCIYESG